MNAIQHVSDKTESYLKLINVQSVDYAKDVTGTSTETRLTSIESAGIIAQLSHSKHRHVIAILAGIDTHQTRHRLAWELAGEVALVDWAKREGTAEKTMHIINFAICRLAGDTSKTTHKSAEMGLTPRAYNQIWREREEQLYRILIDWVHQADNQINKLVG